MRVLVAIAPQMYRETLAHAIGSRLPDVEVQTCAPEDLDRKLALSRPAFLVCHDTASEARECVLNRVEINYNYSDSSSSSSSLDATIFRDAQATRTANIGLERLLTFLDQIAISE